MNMNADPYTRKLIRWGLILIALVILMIGIWLIFLWIGLPKDVLRENITLEEAQSLVSFPICIPTTIPPGLDPNPEIIYDADDANVPEVKYIRLRYKTLGDQRRIFEVFQRYTRSEGIEDVDSESRVQGAEVSLLYWMIPLESFSESKLDIARKQAQTEATFSQTDETVWWLFEIVDPSEYRSTMTQWIRNHVEYRILSYLPVAEIKKVTLSMFDCSTLNP